MIRTILFLVALFAISGLMIPTSAFAGTGDDENDFNAAMKKFSFQSAKLVNFGTEDVPLYFNQIIYAKENISSGPNDILCGADQSGITHTYLTGITESEKSTVTTKIVEYAETVLGAGYSGFGFSASAEFTNSLEETNEKSLESQNIKTDFKTVEKVFYAPSSTKYIQHHYVTDKTYEIQYVPSGITPLDDKVRLLFDAMKDLESSKAQLEPAKAVLTTLDLALHNLIVTKQSQGGIFAAQIKMMQIADPSGALMFAFKDQLVGGQLTQIHNTVNSLTAHVTELENNIETWKDEVQNLADDVDVDSFGEFVSYSDKKKEYVIKQVSANGIGQYLFYDYTRPCEGFEPPVVRSGDDIFGLAADIGDSNLDNFIPLGEFMVISVPDTDGSHPTIQITDENFYTVDGATVDINGITAITDEFGAASFDVVLQEDGPVEVKVSHPDYVDASIIVNFNSILDDDVSETSYEKFVATTSIVDVDEIDESSIDTSIIDSFVPDVSYDDISDVEIPDSPFRGGMDDLGFCSSDTRLNIITGLCTGLPKSEFHCKDYNQVCAFGVCESTGICKVGELHNHCSAGMMFNGNQCVGKPTSDSPMRGGMDMSEDTEIICADKVFIENKRGKIACVTPSTADKLVERGWGTLI